MSERTGPSVNRTRIVGCVILGTVLAVGVVQAATPPLPLRDGVPTLAPLLEKVTPAVVNISVATRAPRRHNPLLRDPFFRHFFNLPEDAPAAPQQSAGSGVIVDAERGYVLTITTSSHGPNPLWSRSRTTAASRVRSSAATRARTSRCCESRLMSCPRFPSETATRSRSATS